MAQFGAKYIKFNPIKEQPEDQLPVYRDEAPVRVGRLCKADLTVNSASGELYADDELAESLSEFASGTLAVETDDMLDEVASVVYGCEVVDKTVHYKAGDQPPEGGLGYVKGLMRNHVRSFKSVFYPRTAAALGNDSAQTRGNSITFGTTNTTFTIFACNSGDWRITEEFATEKEAKAWVDKMLAGAGTTSGGTSPGGGAAGGEDTSGTETEAAG